MMSDEAVVGTGRRVCGVALLLLACGSNVAPPSANANDETSLRLLDQSDDGHWSLAVNASGLRLVDQGGRTVRTLIAEPVRRKYRFWGNDVLAPVIRGRDPEQQTLDGYDVIALDGTKRGHIPVSDVRFTRPSGEALMVVESEQLSRWTKDGQRLWSLPESAHELASARTVDAQLFVAHTDSRRLVHVAGGVVQDRFDCRSAVWNVAIDTQGRYSAATTQNRLYRFDAGRLMGATPLDVAYAVSLAVSDAGQFLVGTQDKQHQGKVLVFSDAGVLLRTWEVGIDEHAFHPAVSFDPEGGVQVDNAGERFTGAVDAKALGAQALPLAQAVGGATP